MVTQILLELDALFEMAFTIVGKIELLDHGQSCKSCKLLYYDILDFWTVI